MKELNHEENFIDRKNMGKLLIADKKVYGIILYEIKNIPFYLSVAS